MQWCILFIFISIKRWRLNLFNTVATNKDVSKCKHVYFFPSLVLWQAKISLQIIVWAVSVAPMGVGGASTPFPLFLSNYNNCSIRDYCNSVRYRPIRDVNKHLRPISLTPVLSKLAEDYVVEQYVKPAVLARVDANQFGTLPGSNTTIALISMLH